MVGAASKRSSSTCSLWQPMSVAPPTDHPRRTSCGDSRAEAKQTTGTICGVRIEEIEGGLLLRNRWFEE